MEKRSRLPYVAMILSMLLPYGVVTYSSAPLITIQEWLFPFWYYVYYLDWPGWSIRIIFTDSWYPFLFFGLLGLLWFVLGLASSKLLHELYLGQMQQNSLILLLLGALASQVVMTSFVMLFVFNLTLPQAIPLPVHTVLVLLLTAFVPERNVE